MTGSIVQQPEKGRDEAGYGISQAPPIFTCPECGKTFKAAHYLAQHATYRHACSTTALPAAAPAGASGPVSAAGLSSFVRSQIQRALQNLQDRQQAVDAELSKLEAPQTEKEAINRQIAAINAAIAIFHQHRRSAAEPEQHGQDKAQRQQVAEDGDQTAHGMAAAEHLHGFENRYAQERIEVEHGDRGEVNSLKELLQTGIRDGRITREVLDSAIPFDDNQETDEDFAHRLRLTLSELAIIVEEWSPDRRSTNHDGHHSEHALTMDDAIAFLNDLSASTGDPFQAYLKDIARPQLLSREEEALLARAMEEGFNGTINAIALSSAAIKKILATGKLVASGGLRPAAMIAPRYSPTFTDEEEDTTVFACPGNLSTVI